MMGGFDMKRAVFLTLAFAFTLALSACSKQSPGTTDDPLNEYDVYFLAGQSNMEGFGFVKDLPDADRAVVQDVYIFDGRMAEDGEDGGGVGKWERLRPGHGTGFETDGDVNIPSDRFGPELSLGRQLRALSPGRRVALIKYSRGGSGLVDGVSGYGSWDPDYARGNGRNQYDNALSTIAYALSVRDIDGDGYEDRLIPAGIIWMQGEADAYENEAAAMGYEANLARLMGLFRAALRADDLPVVIGQIADSGDTPETRVMAFSPEVQQAQKAFVEADACAALVTVTQDFSFLPDGWHYVSGNYVTLGQAFADEMIALRGRCAKAR